MAQQKFFSGVAAESEEHLRPSTEGRSQSMVAILKEVLVQ